MEKIIAYLTDEDQITCELTAAKSLEAHMAVVGSLEALMISEGSLSCNLAPIGNIVGKLSSVGSMECKLTLGSTGEMDIYQGPYEVNPNFVGTILETENKVMRDNVTVKPIEVDTVSNLSGGYTVYIGGVI